MSQVLAAMRGIFNPKSRVLDPFNGVHYGSKASMQLINGPTYQEIEISCSAVDKIRRVSMTLNGEEFIAITPAQLKVLDQQKKIFVDPSNKRVIIRFADFTLRTRAGIRSCELVTKPTDLIFIYVEFDAQVDGDPVLTLSARAKVTAPQPQRYFLPRLITDTWNHNAGGMLPHQYKQRSQFRFLRRMLLSSPTNDIQKIEIWRDDKIEHEVTAADNAFDLAVHNREAVDGYFVLDYLMYGFGEDGKFPTAAMKSLEFKVTKDSAEPITVLYDLVDVVAMPPKAA
ncbi:major capsid protein P2 [Agarivorans sp. DSG3-1]|uniref:major capsid protein P2 n=1 Tax=Agarivorans sp. DSG3-1 TaxID=3342249 RepID=UPI00398ED949